MYVNGKAVDRTTLTDSAWRWVRLSLPSESRRYLQLDLRVSPTYSSPDAPPGTPDAKAMGVMVGQLRAVAQAAR